MALLDARPTRSPPRAIAVTLCLAMPYAGARTAAMPSLVDLITVASTLVDGRMRFCLIGGMALHVWLPDHRPADVDIVIAPGLLNGVRARRALQRLMRVHGDPYVSPLIAGSGRQLGQGRELRLHTTRGRLDVVGDSLPAGWADRAGALVAASQWMTVRGRQLPVCSRWDLLSIKLATGRERDREHAEALRAGAGPTAD